MDKLEICKQTRKFAADSLYKILKKLLASGKPISEVMLRDAWLKELRKNKDIFPDGWYTPPPHGFIILFADDKNIDRVNFKSARVEENWARKNVFLNRKSGIVFLYASPVDKKTGIIGDFGVTLYFGKKRIIQNHFLKALNINKQVFNKVQTGISFSDMNKITHDLLRENNVTSDLLSPTDPTGTNYGHTIPVSYDEWTNEELNILHNSEKNWHATLSMISKKRKFVNSLETLKVKNNMAFTIEPRPEAINNSQIPMVLFHMIALVKQNGKKELLTDFDELFTLVGMDYMIEQ